MRILTKLRKTCVRLKPNKGQGVVLMKKLSSLEILCVGKSKFKCLHKEPTITRFNSLQNHPHILNKQGQINYDQKKKTRPATAQIGQAHGFPSKALKQYTNIPKFHPIIDTTNTPYSYIGKFLSDFLAPLTRNQYSVKECF